MGVVPSVSLLPPDSCGPDVLCRKDCYACRLLKTRKTWKTTLEHNLAAVREDLTGYFHAVQSFLRKEKPKMFRWHVAGDIPSVEYLHSMIWAAHWYPKVKFLCFTKRWDLVSTGYTDRRLSPTGTSATPSNLRIVVSRWPGDSEPRGPWVSSLPQAWISTDKRAPTPSRRQGVFACPGRCDTCGKCWALKPGQHVVLKKH